MGYDDAIRASDTDREGVVDILREAYTEGRLDLNEFDERTTAAYAAKTWAQLRELTRDLPVGAGLGTGLPGRRPAAALTPAGQAGQPSRRASVFVPFVPFVLFWFVVAGAARGGGGLVIPAVILLFVWLRLGMRHMHGRGGNRPGGSPPRAGGGPA